MVDVDVLLLALEDFVPVGLSAIALYVLTRTSMALDPIAGRYVTAALVLIPVGGVTKPIYKTVLALSGGDVDLLILDELLFWFLAPGFLLLAAGLSGARRAEAETGDIGRTVIWVAGAVVVAGLALLAAGSEAWFFLLLTVATVGNVMAVVVLVRWVRTYGDGLAAGLFIASLVIVFGLAWAAASLDQTIAVQWGEQLSSTASQGMTLWGSVRLSRHVTARRVAVT